MKLIEVKEYDVNQPLIQIRINPETKTVDMIFTHSCIHCGGHGCGRHNDKGCEGGTVFKSLDASNLRKTFTKEQLNDIKGSLDTISAMFQDETTKNAAH